MTRTCRGVPTRAVARNRASPDDPRPSRRVAPSGVPVPADGEVVPWVPCLRVDAPEYVGEQIREVAHASRCTHVALILHVLAAYRDERGQPVFLIREEDGARHLR